MILVINGISNDLGRTYKLFVSFPIKQGNHYTRHRQQLKTVKYIVLLIGTVKKIKVGIKNQLQLLYNLTTISIIYPQKVNT